MKELYEKQELFVMEGDRYKKLYAGTKSEDLLDWYQRKNIYFMRTQKPDSLLFSKELADSVRGCFQKLIPFYGFLWRIKLEGEAREHGEKVLL